MSQTDLLGDPLPEFLPQGERLTDWYGLVGHTVLSIFEGPQGTKFTSDLVIFTESRCWITVDAVPEDEDAYLYVATSRGESLADFVPANDLLRHGCISTHEFAAVDAVQKEHAKQANEASKARLRHQLAKLEAQG